MRVRLLLVLCFSLLCVACDEEQVAKKKELPDVSVQVLASPGVVNPFDTFEVMVVVNYAESISVDIDSNILTIDGLEPLELERKINNEVIQGRKKAKMWARYSSENAGVFATKGGAIKATKGDKLIVENCKAEPLYITVRDLLEENSSSGELKTLPPQVELAEDETFFEKWAWLMGIGFFAALGATYLAMRKMRKGQEGQCAVVISPFDKAISELNEIKTLGLIEAGKFEEYYTRLSMCLRHYLEGRFALKAPERTTEEFLYDMNNTDVLTSEQRGHIASFMIESDKAKFAKHNPSLKNADDALDMVLTFVEETNLQEDDK